MNSFSEKPRKNRKKKYIFAVLVFCALSCSCGKKEESGNEQMNATPQFQQQESVGQEENGSVEYRDNTSMVLVPQAVGTTVYQEGAVTVDASDVSEGYVMVKYSGENPKIRMLLTGPSQIEYKYFIHGRDSYEAFPLSEGNGNYHLEVYENLEGNSYALIYSLDFEAQMPDENKAFLYANQYVNYTNENQAVALARQLAETACSDLEVVENVYRYVTENITYDYEKAGSVTSGYLPDIEDTLNEKKGICFDYAALMTAMLRTQRIPTRLEIGYREEVYHAWIGVYIPEQGWIDQIIVFDGENWSLMDPTLASDASESILEKYMENTDTYYQLKFKY